MTGNIPLNFLTGIALVLSSCSYLPFIGETEREEAPFPLKSVEIFMSRASLMGADYEQYKLAGKSLYFECGQMKRGRQSAEIQKFAALPGESIQAISSTARQLMEDTDVSTSTLPAAGSGTNAAFADPGRFLGTLQTEDETFRLKTSVDGVSAAAQPETFYLKKLTSLLRGAAASASGDRPPCGRGSFYGILTHFVPPLTP